MDSEINMNRLFKALLFWTLILVACSPDISTPQTFPASAPTLKPLPAPNIDPTIEIPFDFPTLESSKPKFIVTVSTPHIDPGPDGNFPVTKSPDETCAFVWAHPLLEELTQVFDSAVKAKNPKANAHASAFGEDCIYSDERKVFLAIETDFYIDLPVTNLTDFESFGNWIAETMPIVNIMPPDMTEGSQTGFVEYMFTKTGNDVLTVRVPIQQYNETAAGKTGEVLFRMFYTAP